VFVLNNHTYVSRCDNLFYLKFLKLYLSDRSVIEKVVENLPNPNGAGHLPNDSRFLLHPVLGWLELDLVGGGYAEYAFKMLTGLDFTPVSVMLSISSIQKIKHVKHIQPMIMLA
jgi:hypothetical protein